VSHPLRWDPDLTKAEKGQSILRDPLRAGLAAAGFALAIGSLRPWAEGSAGLQPQQFGGFDGAGDGAILLFFASASCSSPVIAASSALATGPAAGRR